MLGGKTYRAYQPEQALLLPPGLRDWVPAEHLVWFVCDLVDALDLAAIEAYCEAETRGQPPYHPRLMVKLLVYGYCQGVRSSGKIAQRLDEDVAFRALATEAGEPAEEARKAKPRDKNQYNFSDPESRIMKAGGGFEQAYNAQAAVEPVGQLIVGQTLTNEANDKRQMQPLVDAGGADAAEVANEGGQEDLRAAQGDCRAGVRTDQASARNPAVSNAGTGEGAGRMGADLHDAQHLEAAPAGNGLKRG